MKEQSSKSEYSMISPKLGGGPKGLGKTFILRVSLLRLQNSQIIPSFIDNQMRTKAVDNRLYTQSR